MTEPEKPKAPSQDPTITTSTSLDIKQTTCFICHEIINNNSEQKNLEIFCKTYKQIMGIHEYCLRTWLVEKKEFVCPFCKTHSIPIPYRNDDTNWDPSLEELFEKYQNFLPVLGLGIIVQILVFR